jgi:hypothetical protein
MLYMPHAKSVLADNTFDQIKGPLRASISTPSHDALTAALAFEQEVAHGRPGIVALSELLHTLQSQQGRVPARAIECGRLLQQAEHVSTQAAIVREIGTLQKVSNAAPLILQPSLPRLVIVP